MEFYFFKGFLLSISLIMAIGAQNIFVIRTAIKSRLGWLAAFVSSLCDAILIGVGVSASAGLAKAFPISTHWLQFIAAGFLFSFAIVQLLNARKTLRNQRQSVSLGKTNSALKTITLSLGFSLLNPHAYLDTVLLIGGASISLVLEEKLYFSFGAILASFVWFFALAAMARRFGFLFAKPKAAAKLDFASAAILAALGTSLIVRV